MGPHLQYWPAPDFWLGGGIGLAAYVQHGACDLTGGCDQGARLGFDLRAGYARGPAHHKVSFSVEVTPGVYNERSSLGRFSTELLVLIGYQYL